MSSPASNALLEQVLNLPEEERREFANNLYDSLDARTHTKSFVEELNRRWQGYISGTEEAEDWTTARDRLMAKYARE